MKRTLREIADALDVRLIGEGRGEIDGVAGIATATSERLIFVEDQKRLDAALRSHAGGVIAGTFAGDAASDKPLLISEHPKLAFARAAKLLAVGRAEENVPPQVHTTAVVDSSARLGLGVAIEAKSVVSAGASIGVGTRIGAGCVVGAGVTVGSFCEIYPQVTIYPGTSIGDRVIVHAGAVLGSDGFGYVRDRETGRYEKFPQVGRLVIEDDVEIGANATIDRGALEETRIGRGSKIDNLVHVGHNCQIGENVVIAAQTGLSGSVVIENDAVLGGQVGIGERARISEGVLLGGQAGVLPNKIVRGKGVAFWGTPARPLLEYLKQLAALAKLGK